MSSLDGTQAFIVGLVQCACCNPPQVICPLCHLEMDKCREGEQWFDYYQCSDEECRVVIPVARCVRTEAA